MTTPDSLPQLGKNAPSNAPALMLADVLTGVLPTVPAATDHIAKVPSWELGDNDKYGTCGPTSVANHRRMVTANLSGTMDAVALQDVFDLYKRSGNPGFPNEDNGVVMQDMLDALLAGGIGGRKPVAFAKVAAGDVATLNAAIAIFGGVLLGLTLTVAQQRQRVWDVVPGDRVWGGHAVMAARYADPDGDVNDRDGLISWAAPYDVTRNFVQSQEDECWVVIWPEHLGTTSFETGIDRTALAAAYKQLTGKDLVLPDNPPVPPVTPVDPPVTPPAPTPAPGAASFPGEDPRVASEVSRRAARAGMTEAAYVNNALRHYMRLKP